MTSSCTGCSRSFTVCVQCRISQGHLLIKLLIQNLPLTDASRIWVWPLYMMMSSNGNIFRVTGGFPSQRQVTRSFVVFFDLRLNKQLCKHASNKDNGVWDANTLIVASVWSVLHQDHQDQPYAPPPPPQKKKKKKKKKKLLTTIKSVEAAGDMLKTSALLRNLESYAANA